MLLERSSWFTQPPARWLIAWWVGSIVTLAICMFEFLIPMDAQPHLLSLWGIGVVGFMTGAWMAPGFVLGGWKVLLIAIGRSEVRTGTDRILTILFAAWAIGWPMFVLIGTLIHY